MNWKNFTLPLLLLSTVLSAQWNFIGNMEGSPVRDGNTITFACANATVKVEVCTNDIMRIRMSPDGEFAANEPWVVIRYDWPEQPYTLRDEGNYIHLQTQRLTVHFQKSPFGIKVIDEDGRLCYEQPSESMGWKGEEIICKQLMGDDEHFYGLGQHYGESDLRGRKMDLWLTENVTPVPFFMSTAGYGIFFHNTWKSSFDFRESPYAFSAPGGGELDFYFMMGPDFKHLLDSYTNITGKSPMPPKWAFGFYYSKWGVQAEPQEGQVGILRDVKLARGEKDWPLDAVRVHANNCDASIWASPSFHWTTAEWGDFPAADEMISHLHDQNIHPIFWENPGIPSSCMDLYLDGEANDVFIYENNKPWHGHFGYGMDPGSLVDFSNPTAVEWWSGLHDFLADAGADGMAGDHGEEVFGTMYSPSSDMYGDELHNLYSFLYDKATWEALRARNPNKRSIVFGRSLYAGTQRYPMQGTQDSHEEGKNIVGEMMGHINFGLSGVPFRTYTDNVSREYVVNNQQADLNRLSQYLCVSMAGERTGTIWTGVKEADDNYRKYARLKYSLMPYIYSYVWETTQTGLPVQRAMVLEYQDDPETYNAFGQYLLGKEILIAPLWKDDVFVRQIYLPEGEWIDFFNETVYEGNQNIAYHAPIDRIPILVKAGSIIPMGPGGQNYMDENTSELSFHIYPKGNSWFKLYEDDGKSYEYEEGQHSTTLINCKEGNEGLRIRKYKPRGPYRAPDRMHMFCIHQSGTVELVEINGQSAEKCKGEKGFKLAETAWYIDKESDLLWIKTPLGFSDEISLNIVF